MAACRVCAASSPILDFESWTRSWSRFLGNQPAGELVISPVSACKSTTQWCPLPSHDSNPRPVNRKSDALSIAPPQHPMDTPFDRLRCLTKGFRITQGYWQWHCSIMTFCYSAPVWVRSIVINPSVCLSVCLYVCVWLSLRKHICGTAKPIFTNFCADPLWPCRRGSVLL